MTSTTKNSFLYIFFSVLLISSGFSSLATAAEPVLPNWGKIFNLDGSHLDLVDANGDDGVNGVPDYQDLYGGAEAIFIEDNISDGLATDMSVRNGAGVLADEVVSNGTVDAPNDIGNAHVMTVRDASGNLQIYAGVELLSWAGTSPSPNTYIDFEFNQGVVRVKSGVPWPIHGERADGDLLVRMNFTEGDLSSVEIKRWDGAAFQLLTSSAAAQACQSAGTFVFCTGDPALDYPLEGYEVWDMDGNAIPSVAPDGFAEVGIDVAGLLGASTDFTSILIRTPNDIAIGNFSAMGEWASVNTPTQGGNQ